MGETFYSVLGVGDDAETETIRRAYRDLVKECHPDVSDDPAAPEQFARLTTARDVLLDGGERARYDRLGHETYVRRHVDASAWTTGAGTAATGNAGRGAGTDRTSASGQGGTDGTDRTDRTDRTDGTDRTDRTAGIGEDSPGGRTGRGRTDRTHAARDATGGAGGRGRQRTAGVYERVETDVGARPSVAERFVGGVRAVGPWLGVHFVFILSALATGWFTFTQANQTLELSVPAVAFGILVVGLVVFLSVVHVISQLYT
jgi:curved DNA-binding protein CbpA